MATPEDARRANRSLLLGTLHRGGPRSRADLAKQTGLTRATVSAVVRDLLDGRARRGARASTRPAASASRPRSSASTPTAATSSASTSPSRSSSSARSSTSPARSSLRRTYDRDEPHRRRAPSTLVTRICDDLVGDAERPLLGIGVASPGIVDADGVVVTAAHLDWRQLPLGPTSRPSSGSRSHVVNDANAAALAELTFGDGTADQPDLRPRRRGRRRRARARRRACSPARPTRPARSATSSSIPTARSCACGKRGCLETEVSEPLLDRRLGADAGDGTDVLDRAGEHLGIALATVVSALDVGDVVLSGPAIR